MTCVGRDEDVDEAMADDGFTIVEKSGNDQYLCIRQTMIDKMWVV